MTPSEPKRLKRKSTGTPSEATPTLKSRMKREKRSHTPPRASPSSSSSSSSVIVVNGDGDEDEPDADSRYMFVGRVLVIRRLFGGLLYDRWYARWRKKYGSWLLVDWVCIDTCVDSDDTDASASTDMRENRFVQEAIFSPNNARPTVVRYFIGDRFPVVWLHNYVPSKTYAKKLQKKLEEAWQVHYGREDSGGSVSVKEVTDTCFSVMDRDLLRTQHIVGRLIYFPPGQSETTIAYLYLDLYDVNTILMCLEDDICQMEDAHVHTMMSVELGQSYVLETNDKHLRLQVLLEHTKDLSWYQSKVELIKALFFKVLEEPSISALELRDFQQQFKSTESIVEER